LVPHTADTIDTLRGVLVPSLQNDVSITGPSSYDIIQFTNGKLAGGSTFQFGYDLPQPGTLPQPRRVRVTSESLKWDNDGYDDGNNKRNLWAKITIAGEEGRTYERFLGRGKSLAGETLLCDMILMQGDSLTILLLEVEGGEHHQKGLESLFTRRFDGGVESWLGSYKGTGKDGLRFSYKIEEVPAAAAPGGD
jgi:hypothetical protein